MGYKLLTLLGLAISLASVECGGPHVYNSPYDYDHHDHHGDPMDMVEHMFDEMEGKMHDVYQEFHNLKHGVLSGIAEHHYQYHHDPYDQYNGPHDVHYMGQCDHLYDPIEYDVCKRMHFDPYYMEYDSMPCDRFYDSYEKEICEKLYYDPYGNGHHEIHYMGQCDHLYDSIEHDVCMRMHTDPHYMEYDFKPCDRFYDSYEREICEKLYYDPHGNDHPELHYMGQCDHLYEPVEHDVCLRMHTDPHYMEYDFKPCDRFYDSFEREICEKLYYDPHENGHPEIHYMGQCDHLYEPVENDVCIRMHTDPHYMEYDFKPCDRFYDSYEREICEKLYLDPYGHNDQDGLHDTYDPYANHDPYNAMK